jgi:hypothetical protein
VALFQEQEKQGKRSSELFGQGMLWEVSCLYEKFARSYFFDQFLKEWVPQPTYWIEDA